MNSENEFRDILREKLSMKEFSPDAEAWKQAREVIDASRETKKKKFFFSVTVLIIGLLAGTAGFLALVDFGQSDQAIADGKIFQAMQNDESLLKIENQLEETDTEEQLIAEKNEQDSDKNLSDPEMQDTSEDAKLHPTISKKTSTNSKVKTTDVLNLGGAKRSKVPAANSSKKHESNIGQGTNSLKKSSQGNGSGLISATEKSLSAAANENKKTTFEELIRKDDLSQSEVSPQNLFVTEKTAQDSAQVVSLDSVVAQIEEGQAINRIDTAVQSAIILSDQWKFGYNLSVQAGVNYFTGWKDAQGREAQGINPFLGFRFAVPVFKNISVFTGAHYYSIGNLSHSSRLIKETNYGFGVESKYTIITPKRLHYLGVPLGLNFNIGMVHSVGIAFNMAYLVDVTVQEETYHRRFNTIADYKQSKSRGYTEGFKSLDTQMSLIYCRKLVGNLSLNAELIYGFVDVKENDFFKAFDFGRNMGLRCSLVYNVFKK